MLIFINLQRKVLRMYIQEIPKVNDPSTIAIFMAN